MRSTALVLLNLLSLGGSAAFAPSCIAQDPAFVVNKCRSPRWALQAETKDSGPELTASEETVYGVLKELHESELAFRVVVIGNGAILESTAILGPQMKLNKSPSSGKNLVTFASEDSSFEFHLMTEDVSKMVLTEKKNPATDRTMRIMRLTNETGKPICSLILADDSEDAAKWYKTISTKYGAEIEF